MNVVVGNLDRARQYAEELRSNPPVLTDLQASELRSLTGTVPLAQRAA